VSGDHNSAEVLFTTYETEVGNAWHPKQLNCTFKEPHAQSATTGDLQDRISGTALRSTTTHAAPQIRIHQPVVPCHASQGNATHVIHIISNVLIPDMPTTATTATAKNLTAARFPAANSTNSTVAQHGTLLQPGATNLPVALNNTTLYSKNASIASSSGLPFNSSTQWRDPDFIKFMGYYSTGHGW
jgi:hypothetical protein